MQPLHTKWFCVNWMFKELVNLFNVSGRREGLCLEASTFPHVNPDDFFQTPHILTHHTISSTPFHLPLTQKTAKSKAARRPIPTPPPQVYPSSSPITALLLITCWDTVSYHPKLLFNCFISSYVPPATAIVLEAGDSALKSNPVGN